jgi:hypothetical protein
LHFGFEGIDGGDAGHQALYVALILGAKDFSGNSLNQSSGSFGEHTPTKKCLLKA